MLDYLFVCFFHQRHNIFLEYVVALKRAVGYKLWHVCLAAESIQRTSLPLQGVYHVHGGHCFAFGVLAVCNCVTNDILEKHLQHTTRFFVDQSRDSLYSTTPGKSSNCWLGNALDVVSQYFAMPFGASLSEPFSSFTTTRHDDDK